MQERSIEERNKKSAAIARLYLSESLPLTDWNRYTDEQVCEIVMKVLRA